MDLTAWIEDYELIYMKNLEHGPGHHKSNKHWLMTAIINPISSPPNLI